MEDAIVIYSTEEHLNSLSKLAIFIAKRRPSVSVELLCTATTPPSMPSVTFHCLPTPDLPPDSNYNHVELCFEIPRNNNPSFRQALAEISRKSNVRAVILDFFCNYAFDVAADLSIPTYFYNSTGGVSTCLMLYWPTLHANTGVGAQIHDFVDIPGLPLIPWVEMPEAFRFSQSRIYKYFLDLGVNAEKSAGILVNTCLALEQRPLEAMKNGLCSPNTLNLGVYPVGPLVDVQSCNNSTASARHECLRWLDSQPTKSVIYLCFGRRGAFPAQQLREMAVGLENSGYRFLWAVRSAAEGVKLEAQLPEGFLQRTKDRGLVWESWAPQTEVLSHGSVGGFVTHCGQSSMQEAVSLGVPMIGWPLDAEQSLKRVCMVEEMKLALPVQKTAEGFVTAAALEKSVRELIETKKGNDIKRRVAEMKFTLAAAVGEGGSSVVALDKFLATVIGV